MKKPLSNDIDHMFRQHFHGHEVPVSNKDQLWYRIQPDKKNKFLPWILTLGILLASGVTYSIWNEQQNKNNDLYTDITLKTQLSNPTQINDIRISKIENILDSASPDLATHNSNTLTGYRNNSALTIQSNPELSQVVNNQQNTAPQTPSILNDKSTQHTHESKTRKNVKFLQSNNAEEPRTNNQPISNISEKHAPAPAFAPTHYPILQKKSSSLPDLYQRINRLKPVMQLPKLKNGNIGILACDAVTKGRFYLDLYSLAALPLDNNSLNPGNTDQIEYLNTWNERYESLPAISIGGALGYKLPSGIDIALGIEYQRLESQYKTKQTITERITIYDPNAYFFYDDNDNVVWVGDSVTAISTYDRTVAIGNITTLLNVPVQISYSLYQKGPWRLKANAAAIFNISMRFRGRYLRPDFSLITIDAANSPTYTNTTIGVSIEGGLHLGYWVKDRWELYASPRYRFNQQSYWNNREVLNQRRHFIGVRLGVQYHF